MSFIYFIFVSSETAKATKNRSAMVGSMEELSETEKSNNLDMGTYLKNINEVANRLLA